MRLLLDEMLSPAIARELTTRGHDVRAISGDSRAEALSDREVFRLAQSEHRAVVTNNIRDFRPLHGEAHLEGGHFGLIFVSSEFRRTKADTGRLIEALEELLGNNGSENALRGGESWLVPPLR